MNLNKLRLIMKQASSNIQKLSDKEALENMVLYLEFEKLIGKTLPIDYKLIYQDKLYKTIQNDVLVQEQYPPSVETASIYQEINEKNMGTIDDPISYNNNMELEEGKYYIQYDVVYECIRSTETAVFNDLKDLIDIYVVQIRE